MSRAPRAPPPTARSAQTEVRHLVYFLPETLEIHADVKAELRYRSIYEALVYGTDVTISGRFAAPNFADWGVPPADVQWSEATLSVGLTDLRGIRSLAFTLDDQPVPFTPGLSKTQLFRSGLQARLPKAGADFAGRAHSFQLRLAVNGTGLLEFLPLGSETKLTIGADWPHPSFTGAALPAERSIGKDGFSASWAMSYLARSYPPSWRAEDLSFVDQPDGRIGVALVLPGDSYQQTDRIVKYGVLVIGLIFSTIFVAGLLKTTRAHLVQYLLVGSSICIFYMLVLSLSEHDPLRRRLRDRQRRRYRHRRTLCLAHGGALHRLRRGRRARRHPWLDVSAAADGGLRAGGRQPRAVRSPGDRHVRDPQCRLVPHRPARRGRAAGGMRKDAAARS